MDNQARMSPLFGAQATGYPLRRFHTIAGALEYMPDAPHILLLEDCVDSALALSILLRRSGFRVSVAGTVAGAVRLVQQHAFDLAIADLELPDGSGTELVPVLRQRDGATPAIAVTGYDDAEASLAAGFDAHLTKPIQFGDLLRIVRRLLNRPGG